MRFRGQIEVDWSDQYCPALVFTAEDKADLTTLQELAVTLDPDDNVFDLPGPATINERERTMTLRVPLPQPPDENG